MTYDLKEYIGTILLASASPPMGAGRPNDLFRSGIGTIGTYRSTVGDFMRKQ